MSRLFEQAVDKVSRLSEDQQNAIARLMLDEIESDRRWSELAAQSPDRLARLADEAWTEHEAGGSEPLDPL